MPLPCIRAARQFDISAHRPFWMGGERVGWLREADAAWLLSQWPDTFVAAADSRGPHVALHARFDDVPARSAALGAVIDALAAMGKIPGWRNETYAIRNAFDAPPLALIERAASRFFGTMTWAVHLNGIVQAAQGAHPAPRLWIARRSATKATDPGMLDNIVAGGIGWGFDVMQTLVKECDEEAGMDASLALRATAGRCVHVLAPLPEGTQVEQIFVYDLVLPKDFVPRNRDGEVSEHRRMTVDEVTHQIAQGAMTVDASLATLDCLLRHQWIDAMFCMGIDALFCAPSSL